VRILVADDFEDTRDVMKLLLEMLGNEVFQANDGREAVEVASWSDPDLILMDLDMPIMDGIAATKELRRLLRTRDVPIVAMSAHCAHGDWDERALAAGCNECLPKPLDFDSLGSVLSHYVPAKS
jgi:CheY-like chemotaxis protein